MNLDKLLLMKITLSLCTILLLAIGCAGQDTKLILSSNGLDSVKIGMSIPEVERVIAGKLRLYVLPDSIPLLKDSAIRAAMCKDCSRIFTGIYKGVEVQWTFFRFTMYKQTDFELVSIGSNSPLVHTKTGIHIGITEKVFKDICTRNNYLVADEHTDKKGKVYLFSDVRDDNSSKLLMAEFTNGMMKSLMVANMIGD